MLLKLSPLIVLGLLGVVILLRILGVIDGATSSLLSLILAAVALGFGLVRAYQRKRESR